MDSNPNVGLEDISNNLDEIRRVLEGILAEMRRRNNREESILQGKMEGAK